MLRVCEAARLSARFNAKFCPQGAAAPSASCGRNSEGAAGAALRFSQGRKSRSENRLSAREPGGRNFCRATARRNGFPLVVSITACSRSSFCLREIGAHRYRDSLVYERTLLPRKRVVGIEVLCSVVYNKEETICPFVYKSPFYSIDTALFYSKKEYLFAWRDF